MYLIIPTSYSYTTLFRSHDLPSIVLGTEKRVDALSADMVKQLRSINRALKYLQTIECFENTEKFTVDESVVVRSCFAIRSEEHTSELQSHSDLVCRLLLE